MNRKEKKRIDISSTTITKLKSLKKLSEKMMTTLLFSVTKVDLGLRNIILATERAYSELHE